MKFIPIFIACFLITSCSSSKRVSEKTEIQVTEEQATEQNTSVTENSELIDVLETKDTITSKPNTKQEVFTPLAWTELLQKHVSNEGNVNYNGFNTDRKALLSYIGSLGENMPSDTWTEEDKLAYWINTYNALTIDLILRHYPVESIKDIKNPWDQRYWQLGDKWYNLNEIEHDILRKMKEPRIHFAIVCASYSCPKLQNEAFTASKLEEQLTNATKSFINDPEKNDLTPSKIGLSKIFAWFDKDFLINGTGSIIEYINRYSNIKISPKTPKKFKDYDWSLNN
ncbi:DUF547 domain-containing protein [Algibacter luteus]|uniref:DUF547 domain-containing protein n=1 Tax=Algibacter luteus TaxID=1178825 RepID=A0A1M6AJR6_9FLAO|nr:DUF547 domain-containing protein [Algibacter luteus]SHI36754.1 Protein of unknown function, DUF547 [Algibacter luteus]